MNSFLVSLLFSNQCEQNVVERPAGVNDSSDDSSAYQDDSSLGSTFEYQLVSQQVEVGESDVEAPFNSESVDAERGLLVDDGKGPAVQEVEPEGSVPKICFAGCTGGNLILGDRDTYWKCDGECSRSFHYDCVLYNESFATRCVRGGRGRCYHCTIGHSCGSVCKAVERIDRGFYCDDCWGWMDSEKSTTESLCQVVSSDDEEMETTIIITRKRKLVAMVFESRGAAETSSA